MATTYEHPQLEGLPVLSTISSAEDVKITDVDRDSKDGALDEKDVYSPSVDSGSKEFDDAKYVNGEPVITTGKDVSRFAVDLRDDEDPAITFRSMVLGTVFAGLGAALVQVYLHHNSPLSI